MGSKSSKEADEKNKQKDEKPKEEEIQPASFFSLFQYASRFDKILLAVGTVFAIIMGAGFPTLVILMGKITDTFVEYTTLDYIIYPSPDLPIPIPGPESRHAFYNSTLHSITDPMEYFLQIKIFYENFANISNVNQTADIMPDVIRSKLGYSIEKFVAIYNDSVFQDGELYVDNFRNDCGLLCLYMALTCGDTELYD